MLVFRWKLGKTFAKLLHTYSLALVKCQGFLLAMSEARFSAFVDKLSWAKRRHPGAFQ